MENRHNANQRPGWSGYVVAIVVSAIGHVGLLAFALFVLPQLLHSETVGEQTYTVKMVDNIPAGDLGTHLPKLSGRNEPPPEQVAKAEVKPEEPKVTPPPPPEEKQPPPPPPPKPEDDKNAISLNASTVATPTPPPPPAVIAATPEPTAIATPPKIAEPAPTPEPKPRHRERVVAHNLPKNPPKNLEKPSARSKRQPIQMADVQEQFRALQKKLLQQRIEQAKKEAADSDADSDDEYESDATPSANDSGGPIAGTENIEGKGSGIGSGEGTAGELRDFEFLNYYRSVQQKIKESWTFPGGSSDLTAAVEFGIGPDGSLEEVKISKGSGDPAFDDSVIRAIKRAAPFQPPPDKFRSQFADILSTFKLGELKS